MTSGELVSDLTDVIVQLRADPSTQCTPAAEALEKAVTEIEGLSTAVGRRTVLGQATGLLMSEHGLTADQAWYVLTTHSQRSNRKAYDMACDLVARHEEDSVGDAAAPSSVESAQLQTQPQEQVSPSPSDR